MERTGTSSIHNALVRGIALAGHGHKTRLLVGRVPMYESLRAAERLIDNPKILRNTQNDMRS